MTTDAKAYDALPPFAKPRQRPGGVRVEPAEHRGEPTLEPIRDGRANDPGDHALGGYIRGTSDQSHA
jgi:hypothetical protein